jgi:hypothetical protein
MQLYEKLLSKQSLILIFLSFTQSNPRSVRPYSRPFLYVYKITFISISSFFISAAAAAAAAAALFHSIKRSIRKNSV